MAVTLVAIFAAWVGTTLLRPHLRAPLRAVHPVAGPDRVPAGAWLLDKGWVDAAGHVLAPERVGRICPVGGTQDVTVRCLADHGVAVRAYEVFQPASRFWAFQGIETAIYLALAAALLGLAWWWTVRWVG
jgi:hypothetical protein